jgi:uncharacterized RDD family membrane protein YckC
VAITHSDIQLNQTYSNYVASLIPRYFAACIDYLPAIIILFWRPIFHRNILEFLYRTRIDWSTAIFAFAFYLLTNYFSIKHFKATLGQRIFGLQIVNAKNSTKSLTVNQILIKLIMSPWLTLISLSIPAFALFRNDRRTLADLMANVKIVYKNPSPTMMKKRWIIGSFLVLINCVDDIFFSENWSKLHLNKTGFSIGLELYRYLEKTQRSKEQVLNPPTNSIRKDLEYEWQDYSSQFALQDSNEEPEKVSARKYFWLYQSLLRVKNIVQTDSDIAWIKDKYCKPLIEFYQQLGADLIKKYSSRLSKNLKQNFNHEAEVEYFCSGKILLKDYDYLIIGPNVLDRICYAAKEFDLEYGITSTADYLPNSLHFSTSMFNDHTISNLKSLFLFTYYPREKFPAQYYYNVLDAAAEVGEKSWQCCTKLLGCPNIKAKTKLNESLTDQQRMKLASLLKLSDLQVGSGFTSRINEFSVNEFVIYVKENIRFTATLIYQGRLPVASSRINLLLPKITIEDFVETQKNTQVPQDLFSKGSSFDIIKRGYFTSAGLKKITIVDSLGISKEVFATVNLIDKCIQSKQVSNPFLHGWVMSPSLEYRRFDQCQDSMFFENYCESDTKVSQRKINCEKGCLDHYTCISN